jgi:hypothetical protein
MFYARNVIVPILISSGLRCASSHTFLCSCLILSCVSILAAFEWSFIARLRALASSFVVSWCSAFERGSVDDVPCGKVFWGFSICLFC